VTIFAYVAAIWLVVGGSATLWRKSFRFGVAALTILYGIFVVFPLPRLLTAPHYLGYRTAVYIGVVANICEQFVLFVAAVVVWGSLAAQSPMSQRRAIGGSLGVRVLLACFRPSAKNGGHCGVYKD
jgi:hypothetical protein